MHLSRDLQTPDHVVSLITTGGAIASVAGQFLATWLARRYSAQTLLVAATGLIAMVPASWLLVRDPWMALLPFALQGLGWAVAHIVCFDLTIRLARGASLEAASAGHQGMVFIGSLAGPFIGAALSGYAGADAAFAASTAGTLLAAVVYLAPSPRLVAARVRTVFATN